MGKFTLGGSAQTVALNFNTNAPLDDRTVVTTKASLIGKDTWIKAEYLFKGLITSVQETNELYMYIGNIGTTFPADFLTDTTTTNPNVSDETIAKYWKKVSSSGLENLSGVFAFKGVAEAISPDQRIITTREVATATVTDDEGKVITDSEPLYCVTTAYEFDMDVYYGWGTSLNDIRFWTDTTTVTSGTSQYDKGEQLSVTAYEFNNKLYYPTETKDKYESVDGEVVYIKENQVYQTADSQTSLGHANEVSYKGYAFKEKTSKLLLEADADSESISASSDNSGHVYQIGENEYASNGQIWVKLGSPVEDWIIL